MTSQSPRIYIYKITFEEVLYYYYGVHKEKRYNEYYMGSPVTHKWMWDFYTPKKQILEIFPFTDEGWKEAQEIEKRLIKPFYNTDKWCLNEGCGSNYSLETRKRNGKKFYELGIGMFSLTKEDKIEIGKKLYELGLGVHGRDKEQIIEDGRKGGIISSELAIGVHALTPEQRIAAGRKGGSISGKKNYENGIGLVSITKEERKQIVAKTNSQRWMCTETGYVTTPGPLTSYQRAKGIDTSKRKRIS